MTLTSTEIFNQNLDKLIGVTGKVLKAAQNSEASPQDAIEVIDDVVDELTELRQAIPGGDQEPEEEEEEEQEPVEKKPVPPGAQAEPAAKEASLEKDTVEESSEKVNKQNAEQLALKNKTYSMTAKEQDLTEQLKLAKERIAELETTVQRTELENIAEEYSLYFQPGQRKAKFDEVMSSDKPTEYWETKIEAFSEIRGNSVRPAKSESTWLPQKSAKLNGQARLKHL